MKTSYNMISIIVFCLFLLTTHAAYASPNHGYAVDLLKGEGNVTGVKLAYQYYPEGAQNFVGDARFYLESSINLWHYRHDQQSQSNLVLAVSPVVQFPAFSLYNTPFYVEAGIGFSLLDERYFADKNLSTHYQFEDRIGLVADFGETNVALRIIHYSNAGFKSPNPGINFLTLSVAQRF
ncbi:acyloxyacyl hydrolase [Pseudoalteromonas sp. S3260]|jgi:hypothetical protein|uniref:acyloxyacyl hydrolase n=1 Tax=Pseudoalteromonas sp. S3260 TaxID=579534 RepID=UPI00110B52E5|nr:acyloxyacyl hydrolase [Pseudoalteromonas sp. S3260]TMO98751.1 acyloxyacyl hydrolase [Pseudoalteromonas sp. S3260]